MDKAEEFFQSKNGSKSSILANKHGELISPIWAVELMEQYAQQVNRENEKIAFIAGMGFVLPGLKSENYKEDAFNEWKSNQEESNKSKR